MLTPWYMIEILTRALERYGQHEHPYCSPSSSACACGLYIAQVSRDFDSLHRGLHRFARHEEDCHYRNDCTCGLGTVMAFADEHDEHQRMLDDETLLHQLMAVPLPSPAVVKIGPTSVIVEVEETILLPAPLPVARVVPLRPLGLSTFWRGFLSGAVGTSIHMIAHWLGIW